METESSETSTDAATENQDGNGPPLRRGTSGRLVRLCLKELREILRDRRTIATLLLMPLLVYPLMVILLQKLQMQTMGPEERKNYIVGLSSEEQAFICRAIIDDGHQRLKALEAPAESPADRAKVDRDAPVEPEDAEGDLLIEWRWGPDVETQVAEQRVDVALHFEIGEFPTIELVYREDSSISRSAAQYVEDRIRAVQGQYLKSLLRQLHVDITRVPPETLRRPIASAGPPVSISAIIPLILILMTITGAVYPAIDLTAGERERGTLETLMAAPVPRLGLLFAKYVAVVTVALLTAGVNLLAMGTILLFTGLGEVVLGEDGLTATLVFQIAALLVLFVAFFSAVLLALTSFARSFKEAQAYLIPLTLLALAPGVVSLMPQVQNNLFLSLLPMANLVLLARDLFEGHADPTLATAAVLSSGIYSLAAIALAARIFGTDAVLYGSQASLLDLLFRRGTRETEANITAATLCLAVIFPPYFLLAVMLANFTDVSLKIRLGLSALITAVLFGGLPWFVGFIQRVRIREAFRLHRTSTLAFLGAMVLGVTLWPFAYEIFLLNKALGLTSLSEERLQLIEQLLEGFRNTSPWLLLFTLAVVPAVFEEFFFRGYLFSAFRRSFSPTSTMVFTALVFGVFHVVVTDMLSMERFLPSVFIGLVLAWVCWRTGSIFPGMVLHACHNGLLLMVSYYRDELQARGWGIAEETHLPVGWLAVATLGIAVGIAMLLLVRRRSH
ncbi:MAG: ABC transporter permease subunit/CPBP intramembrane protease [Pirellulaceae bacterium]